MDAILTLLGAIILGVFAFIFAKKSTSKAPFAQGPPKSAADIAASEALRKDFEEEVAVVEQAKKGIDPAAALANLGNARRR